MNRVGDKEQAKKTHIWFGKTCSVQENNRELKKKKIVLEFSCSHLINFGSF